MFFMNFLAMFLKFFLTFLVMFGVYWFGFWIGNNSYSYEKIKKLREDKEFLRKLFGGKAPIDVNDYLWKLIDLENQKPEDEIRCDYIEAWEEAADRVKDYGDNNI